MSLVESKTVPPEAWPEGLANLLLDGEKVWWTETSADPPVKEAPQSGNDRPHLWILLASLASLLAAFFIGVGLSAEGFLLFVAGCLFVVGALSTVITLSTWRSTTPKITRRIEGKSRFAITDRRLITWTETSRYSHFGARCRGVEIGKGLKNKFVALHPNEDDEDAIVLHGIEDIETAEKLLLKLCAQKDRITL
jgi:hypothetical protein